MCMFYCQIVELKSKGSTALQTGSVAAGIFYPDSWSAWKWPPDTPHTG